MWKTAKTLMGKGGRKLKDLSIKNLLSLMKNDRKELKNLS